MFAHTWDYNHVQICQECKHLTTLECAIIRSVVIHGETQGTQENTENTARHREHGKTHSVNDAMDNLWLASRCFLLLSSLLYSI